MMSSRSLARAVVLSGCCLAAACPSAELALSVDIKTDLAPGTEFGAVRTELFGERPTASSVATTRADRPALRTDDFASGRRAAEFAVDVGVHWLRLRLLASDGRVVVERLISVHVTASRAVTVVVTRSCASITCAAGQTCIGGACVEPDCTGASCSPECTTATDCATMATCATSECADGACFYAGRMGACAVGEWCDPAVGCVRDTTIPDAGPSFDAGPLDAGGIAPGMDAGGLDSGGCARTCPPGFCGDDGCGRPCATADCSGRSCGPDPVCGTSCGTCDTGYTCDDTGNCACGGLGAACSGGSCCGPAVCSGTCCIPNGGSCGAMGDCCSAPGITCTSGECCTQVQQTCGSGAECCPGRNCVDGVCCVALFDGCSSDPQCCNFFSANVGCRSGRCCWTAGHGCVAASAGNCCDGTCIGGVC